jgi:UDP-N-acetyl-D-galactosamine dehydrogenase
VAEAAKVIENTQRDINIALINELSIIFNRIGIDTEEVLEAAGTKWNFLPFRPGLVGGHCIGVDPYYLTHKAQLLGYHPELILAGRRLNDNMASYVVSQLIKTMLNKSINLKKARILIMGLTFKENCPDIRNTKVADIFFGLRDCNIDVDIYDPKCSKDEVKKVYGVDLIDKPVDNFYDGIVLAVAHDEFKKQGIKKIKHYGKDNHVIYDLKYLFNRDSVDIRL